jgi:hypothetical protein
VQTIVTLPNSSTLVSEVVTTSIIQRVEAATIVQSGSQQGLRGAPGRDGVDGQDGASASLYVSCIASGAIGGGRVVRIIWDRYVGYVSSDDITQATTVLGITTGAAAHEDQVYAQYMGEIVDSGWNWVPGPVYCGINGVITQTVPTTGFILMLGTAINSTTIVINIKQPLILS